jgi:hypothetical protein
MVIALTFSGRTEEALSVAPRLIDLAEATSNPFVASCALNSYGMTYSAHDPSRAVDALRRGLKVAQDTDNRANEGYLAMALVMTLNRIEGELPERLAALDHIASVIGNYHDSGNITQLRAALGLFVVFLERRGDREAAAVISGFAGVLPTAAPMVPEFGAVIADLRDVLGAQTYESLAREGRAMSMAAMVPYAYDRIDHARAELEQLP